jgi:hypothetical protein
MDEKPQTTESNDDFIPIKIDPSKMEELMLRLDDRGLEDRLHTDFYDNLINFGIDKKYVDSMRDEFVCVTEKKFLRLLALYFIFNASNTSSVPFGEYFRDLISDLMMLTDPHFLPSGIRKVGFEDNNKRF